VRTPRTGANGPALYGGLDVRGIFLRGDVLFIEVDAKALNPLKTTSIKTFYGVMFGSIMHKCDNTRINVYKQSYSCKA
jgi:hypothetical protein